MSGSGMFTNFLSHVGNLFSDTNPNGHQQPTPQQQQRTGKAPPASQNAIDRLPMVKVTADDLLEAANKECTVCLDEQKLGNYCVKLQCGHLFHRDCLTDWLKCQCTCPVCRFEIETDDKTYEADRKSRMKKRKLRFRIDELKGKSVGQLKELCKSLVVNIANCIDKSEIIDCLVNSGKILITEGIPPMEITLEDFNRKTVSELKHLLLSFGLSAANAVEKSELRVILLDSKRIVIIIEEEDDSPFVPSSSSNYGDSAEGYKVNHSVSHDSSSSSKMDYYDTQSAPQSIDDDDVTSSSSGIKVNSGYSSSSGGGGFNDHSRSNAYDHIDSQSNSPSRYSTSKGEMDGSSSRANSGSSSNNKNNAHRLA
jgi:hypothetical protein